MTQSAYEYNHQNRMVRSRVIDDEARTIASTRYGYDPLGRRTLVQDNNAATLRTLYDGLSFDVVKESPVYASGGFVDTYNTGIQYTSSGRATGERYRYLDDGQGTSEKYQYIEDSSYQTVSSRYSGERTMLYAHGSPVAINRSGGTRGYLGTDILGSTRSVTDNHGLQESYYDYDIFGSPVAGDFTTGADYGYLGKPYDSITGLYNYGYRDYSPQTVRFTTVDPIRDGSNWFAYVNNDPVNYVDLWGLLASEGKIQNQEIVFTPKVFDNPRIASKFSTSITVSVLRTNDNYGNSFDSMRITTMYSEFTGTMTYIDMIGANAANEEFAKKNEGMTLPDGEYYLTGNNLIKQPDGTFNSGTYENVYRLETNDSNIPETTRDKINSDFYLVHANQRMAEENVYSAERPWSAGCSISQGGQSQHDVFMDFLKLADRPEDIRYIISSGGN